MKNKIIALVVIGILLLPGYLISTPGLDMMVTKSKQNLDTAPWAPGMLFKAGSMAYITARIPKAVEIYGGFLDYYGADHELSGWASFRLGDCYDKLGQRSEAADEYRWFLENFPSHPMAREATSRIRTLENIPTWKKVE